MLSIFFILHPTSHTKQKVLILSLQSHQQILYNSDIQGVQNPWKEPFRPLQIVCKKHLYEIINGTIFNHFFFKKSYGITLKICSLSHNILCISCFVWKSICTLLSQYAKFNKLYVHTFHYSIRGRAPITS